MAQIMTYSYFGSNRMYLMDEGRCGEGFPFQLKKIVFNYEVLERKTKQKTSKDTKFGRA